VKKIVLKSKNRDISDLPLMGYASGYVISKFFDKFDHFSFLLDKIETKMLFNDVDKIRIDKPVYITGLARAGTTIVLEMLDKHPDLATHRYQHLFIPYIPNLISVILNYPNVFTKSYKRLHQDGIMITRESPEAVEEIFWQKFFANVHNEEISNVMNGNISNPEFEQFYKKHLRKLIIYQESSRYLAKNNYNITRLEYLLRLFPSSKFLLIIRDPVSHIASLIKQTKLFMEIERKKRFLKKWLRIIGHYEFGHNQVCINVGNTELIHRIRKLWENKKTYVKGWAHYWTSIYDFIAKCIDNNKSLKNATLIIKYGDLCENPANVIDQILDHAELPSAKFEKVKKYYVRHLHKPSYYSPNFTKQNIAEIREITKNTAAKFGF